MWSEILPSGKVRYVERFIHPLTGKYVKVSVTMDKDTKSNRKNALFALQKKISAQVKDLSSEVKTKNLRLSELVTLYLEDISKTVKMSTLVRNKTATNSMMRILGKDVMVDKLTASYVKMRLLEQNEKPGTTNERLVRFKAMIRWGYENEYINDIRWLDKLSPSRDDEKRKKLEDKFLESNELNLLLENMDVPKWKFLAELTALSGMRCGEALALHTSDIDFENRVIHVNKNFDIVNKITTSPKTEDSNREVFMQDQLFQLCKDIKEYMENERTMANYKSDLFMSRLDGKHLDYYAYNKYLKETSLRVLGKKISTHYMRHTHVALLSEQGIPLDVISRRIGHSDSEVTKRIYFHVTEKLKEKDNERIKGIKIL